MGWKRKEWINRRNFLNVLNGPTKGAQGWSQVDPSSFPGLGHRWMKRSLTWKREAEAGRAWLDKEGLLGKQDYRGQVVQMSFLLLKEMRMKWTLQRSLWELLWPGGWSGSFQSEWRIREPWTLGGLPWASTRHSSSCLLPAIQWGWSY